MKLHDGATVGIIGGGPAGAFSAYFLLEFAERLGISLKVIVFEPKAFDCQKRRACNHCGGIVSESLVQLLSAEGICLPERVVQRGIDSYRLHCDGKVVTVRSPLSEGRLAALHRGKGPASCNKLEAEWESFDHFLLTMAESHGAIREYSRIEAVNYDHNGCPILTTEEGKPITVDFLIGAFGINARNQPLMDALRLQQCQPSTIHASISEVFAGREVINSHYGSQMHLFWPPDPSLHFAAIIPKGHFLTVCIIGQDTSGSAMHHFLEMPEVAATLPEIKGKIPVECQCHPLMNVRAHGSPFRDRVALVGDCAVSRLYKDGIGAAYRLAKSVAMTAVFHGISQRELEMYAGPAFNDLKRDNAYGRALFKVAEWVRQKPRLRAALLAELQEEACQLEHSSQSAPSEGILASLFWDLFTGSATYRDITRRGLKIKLMRKLIQQAWRAGKTFPAHKGG